MKIYELSKIPGIGNEPPKEPDYEAIFASGYSAGYEDGYASVPCYKNQYLTIEMTTSGAIKPTVRTGWNIEYRLNGGEWINMPVQPLQETINVETGDKIEFRGLNNTVYGLFEGTTEDCITGSCIVYGNIMSLFYHDNFRDKTVFPSITTGSCRNVFAKCLALTDATNLVMPADVLYKQTYWRMFSGCTNLEYAPAILPATTLAHSCYRQMFQGCSSLTTTPELPAMTLAESCYEEMFHRCSSLTTAPELPATTLAPYCYRWMLERCNFTTAPELPATTLATGCYWWMFSYCYNLVEAPELPAMTLVEDCYKGMFQFCGLTEAPELPATTLAENCYEKMFDTCTALEKSPVLPASVLVTACYKNMFGGCTNLAEVKCLATDISATDCTYYWLAPVSNTGIFYKHPSTTWPTGQSGIPRGWTVVDVE